MKALKGVLLILMLTALAGCSKDAADSKINTSISVSSLTSSTCEITTQGIGRILLGDTQESVIKKIPTVKFENSTDGEGVEWLSATYEGITVLIAEGDFNYLQVQDNICKTKAGATVGMEVGQLEKIYGKVLRATTNDANSEEEVFFEKAPNNISFKGYGLGNFEAGQADLHVTQKINSKGIVEFISVYSGK